MPLKEIKCVVRSSISTNPDCYDYEVKEAVWEFAEPPAPDEIRETFKKLNNLLISECVVKPGTPKVGKAYQGTSANGRGSSYGSDRKVFKKSGGIDFNAAYCKWDIPFPIWQKMQADGTADTLKRCGARFNRDDKCWYSENPIDGTEFLDEYKKVLNPVEKSDTSTDDPDWL